MNNTKNSDSKWDWIPCTYNLKKEVNGKSTFWNLSPSIILTNPSGEGPDPNVKLFIDTEKSLQYSNELGWNWHKSWNLPNISLRLEIKDSTTQELLLCPKNLYAHLFAVKAVLDHSDNFHLVDVGLRGVNRIELLDGHAFFSAIKFASTSYNNEGVKFHLVLSLYIMSEDEDTPKVLNSTISPPIFVDSRKSARDSHVLLEKKMSSFVEPFLPESLEKLFIKRENKRKNDIEIQIQNDFEGLFNYLTAPNIRHKVKHPLFLHLKFSNCVQLYVNNDLYQRTNLEGLIETLQKRLCEDHYSKRSNSGNTKIENKMFILLIEESSDSFKNKKITEAVEPLQCNSLEILFSQSLVPPNFKRIENNVELLSLYKKNYATLFATTKLNKGSNDDNGNKRDSSDSEGESEDMEVQPQKKLKVAGDYNLGHASNINDNANVNEEGKEDKSKPKASEKEKAPNNGFKAPVDSNKQGDGSLLAKTAKMGTGEQTLNSIQGGQGNGSLAQVSLQQQNLQQQTNPSAPALSKASTSEAGGNKSFPSIPQPSNLPASSASNANQNPNNQGNNNNINLLNDASRNFLGLLGSSGMGGLSQNQIFNTISSLISSHNQQPPQNNQNMSFLNQYSMPGQGLGGVNSSPIIKNSQIPGQSGPQSQTQPSQPQVQQSQQSSQQSQQQLLNLLYQQGAMTPQILQQIPPEFREALLKGQGKQSQSSQSTPQSQGFGGLNLLNQAQVGMNPSQQGASQSVPQQPSFSNPKSQANIESLMNQLMAQSGNNLNIGGNRGFPPGVGGLGPSNPFNQLESNNPFPYKHGGMMSKNQMGGQNSGSIPGSNMSGLSNGSMFNLLGIPGQSNPGMGFGGGNMQNPMYLQALIQKGMNELIKKEEENPNK